MQLDTLEDLYTEQLMDIRSAENQLIEAMPKMVAAASNDELRHVFEEHLKETRVQLERVENILNDRKTIEDSETCNAMKGLIEEAEELIKTPGDPIVKDAALIAAAQRVEHYEIAAYGTVVAFADQLDDKDHKTILELSLGEESEVNKKLNKLATGGLLSDGLNKEATPAS